MLNEKTFRQAAERSKLEYEVLTDGERNTGWVKDHNRRIALHLMPIFGKVGLSTIIARRPAAMLPADVLQLMRQWGGGHLSPERHRYLTTGCIFPAGDTVRVATDPLQGQVFRVVDVAGPSVRALLDILGGEVEVEIQPGVPEAVPLQERYS